MTQPIPLADLRTFIGNFDAQYTRYALGADPASIAGLLKDTLGDMGPNDRKALGTIFLLAAFTNRRLILEILMKPDMALVNRYLSANWSIKGNLNFSNLNLAGNMIVAAHISPGTPLIESYRSKLRGRSIWDVNINTSKLSEQAKLIALERVDKIQKAEALNYGTIIILVLMHGPRGAIGQELPAELGNFDAGAFFAAVNARNAPVFHPSPAASNVQGGGANQDIPMTSEQIRKTQQDVEAAARQAAEVARGPAGNEVPMASNVQGAAAQRDIPMTSEQRRKADLVAEAAARRAAEEVDRGAESSGSSGNDEHAATSRATGVSTRQQKRRADKDAGLPPKQKKPAP